MKLQKSSVTNFVTELFFSFCRQKIIIVTKQGTINREVREEREEHEVKVYFQRSHAHQILSLQLL